MSVKITLDDPVVVAQSGTYEALGWGPCQFPALHRLPDGRIAASWHMVNDTQADYGLERGWGVSEDGGRTWTPVAQADIPAIKRLSGLRMPSGRILRSVTPRPYRIGEELHQQLAAKLRGRRNCLGPEEIPDGLFGKNKWLYAVYDPATGADEEYEAELDFPGMTLSLIKGAIVRSFPFGTLRLAPDGSVWQTHYWTGRNPYNLGFTSYYACYFLRSTDEGRSFRMMSWIQYLPDSTIYKDAFMVEGYCEPDIAFTPDAGMIALMRTGSSAPSAIARSEDGGRTWSRPAVFDKCGVYPQLLRLDCGVTLASYGRPGLFLRATDDPRGLIWDEPIDVTAYRPGMPLSDTCAYTGMIAAGDRDALLIWSDFHYPDQAGQPRKTILVRAVHVETN